MFDFSVEMDSHTLEVSVLGEAKVKVDLRKLPSVSRKRVLVYGLGRFIRDGNSPEKKVWSDGALPEYKDGKVVTRQGVTLRDRTAAEREADALAMAQETVADLYAGKVGEGRVGRKADPTFDQTRRTVYAALRAAGIAAKAIPAMPNTEACQKVAEAHGLKWTAVQKKVAAILAASDLSDLKVEV